MTDVQLGVLLDSIALNLENEIYYLEEQLPRELIAYKQDAKKDDSSDSEKSSDPETEQGIPYFPCTELLWDFAKRLRQQAKALESQQPTP